MMLQLILSFILLQPTYFLDSYQWKNRVLLIYSQDVNDPKLKKQLAILEEGNKEYAERDVRVFYVLHNQIFDDKGTLMCTLHPRDPILTLGPKSFGVVLIGKDGGKKMEVKNIIGNEFIFQLIDTMPMRKIEQQKNK